MTMLIFAQALDTRPVYFPAGPMCITSSSSPGRSSTSWSPYVLVSELHTSSKYHASESTLTFLFFELVENKKSYYIYPI